MRAGDFRCDKPSEPVSCMETRHQEAHHGGLAEEQETVQAPTPGAARADTLIVFDARCGPVPVSRLRRPASAAANRWREHRAPRTVNARGRDGTTWPLALAIGHAGGLLPGGGRTGGP